MSFYRTLNGYTFGYHRKPAEPKWNEAQFDTESRMKWEKKPVDELHYTPGNPFNIRCGIGILF